MNFLCFPGLQCTCFLPPSYHSQGPSQWYDLTEPPHGHCFPLAASCQGALGLVSCVWVTLTVLSTSKQVRDCFYLSGLPALLHYAQHNLAFLYKWATVCPSHSWVLYSLIVLCLWSLVDPCRRVENLTLLTRSNSGGQVSALHPCWTWHWRATLGASGAMPFSCICWLWD